MPTIFPSNNAWITPRSTSSKITTNNCQIITNQKIDSINKIVVKASTVYASGYINGDATYDINVAEISTTNDESGYLKELDITKYVVEQALYNTLSIAPRATETYGRLFIQNTSYYASKSNIINIVAENIKGAWETWGVSAFSTMIESALYDLSQKGLWVYRSGSFVRLLIGGDVRNESRSQDPRSAQFRVYYTSLGESVKLQTPKTNPQPNQFHIPYSQQQPIVDNITLGREMQSVANRTGCEKREVVRTFRDIKDYRNPHDNWYSREKDANGKYTGNVWRLTGARLEIYCETMYRVIETWSKNWSYRSEKVPINREFRSWNIPADIVQRNLHWNDYCLITRKVIDLPKTALLSANAKLELLRGLDGSASGKITECNNMWFYRINGSKQYGVALSCSSFGFGNTLVFSGRTKDNLSAGVQRVKNDDKDSNYQFCKDVYYCDDDGKLDKMYVQIGSALFSSEDAQQEATYMYPQFKRGYRENGTMQWINAPAASLSNSVELFKEHEFKVLKDPSEQLNFTYQLHMLTDDGYLVIGSSLAANNPLVKEREKAQAIKVWKLKQYLPHGAQVKTAIYGTEQQSDLFEVVLDSDNPSFTFNPEGTTNDGVGVCVTDENNAVLIAFNDKAPATFNIKFTHDYKAIAKALKK